MSLLQRLQTLSAAEEFFDVLEVPYDPAVLRVVRLHVLKRFHDYLQKEEEGIALLDEGDQKLACQALLCRAYDDFLSSSPLKEKVFKVFQDQNKSMVSVEALLKNKKEKG